MKAIRAKFLVLSIGARTDGQIKQFIYIFVVVAQHTFNLFISKAEVIGQYFSQRRVHDDDDTGKGVSDNAKQSDDDTDDVLRGLHMCEVDVCVIFIQRGCHGGRFLCCRQ